MWICTCVCVCLCTEKWNVCKGHIKCATVFGQCETETKIHKNVQEFCEEVQSHSQSTFTWADAAAAAARPT